MIRVKTVPGLLVVCAGFAIPMQTASAAPFDTYVTKAATRANIPPAWITAVMRAESQGDVHAASPWGAMGLMQIMPDTWRELRATLNLGANPYDPHDNITAGRRRISGGCMTATAMRDFWLPIMLVLGGMSSF